MQGIKILADVVKEPRATRRIVEIGFKIALIGRGNQGFVRGNALIFKDVDDQAAT